MSPAVHLLVALIASALCGPVKALTVESCVSFPNTRLDPVFNVKWNSDLDTGVSIDYDDMSVNATGNNVTNLPLDEQFAAGRNQEFESEICLLDNSAVCQSTVNDVELISNVNWTSVNDTSLQFVVTTACRTALNFALQVGSMSQTDVQVNMTNEFSTQNIIVLVHNVDRSINNTYRISTILNGVALQPMSGNVTAIPSPVSMGTPIPSTTSMMPSISATRTTAATTLSSAPTTSSTMMPSNSVEDRSDDDDDNIGLIPIVVAAAVACLLLLLIAIVLIVIIVKIRRSSQSKNISNSSASKSNAYDDLNNVKYFPMSESQNRIQGTHLEQATVANGAPIEPQYEQPALDSPPNQTVIATYDVLTGSDDNSDGCTNTDGNADPAYDAVCNSSEIPDPLYDPVCFDMPKSGEPHSPTETYDKLVHSDSMQNTQPSDPRAVSATYSMLNEELLRNHYEFPPVVEDQSDNRQYVPPPS